MAKRKAIKTEETIIESDLVEQPAVEEKVSEEIPIVLKVLITFDDYIAAGWKNVQQSEAAQKQGKIVKEIKIVEGKTLHKLEN